MKMPTPRFIEPMAASALLVMALSVLGCSEQDFTVNLDQPLRIVAVEPGGMVQGVGIDATVRVTFSEEIKEQTLNPGSFYLERLTEEALDSGTPERLSATVTYDAETLTASLQPEGLLDYSVSYRAVVTTSVERKREPLAPLPVDVKWVFSTQAPPDFHLVSFEPGAGSSGVPIDADIRVTFNSQVEPSSVDEDSFRVFDVDTGEPIDGRLNVEEREIEFSSLVPFGYSRHVGVELTEAIASTEVTSEGGFLEQPVSISFRTIHPPPLLLLSALPSPGSSQVSTNANLSFRFSEDISTDLEGIADSISVQDLTNDPDTNLCSQDRLSLIDSTETGQPDGFSCEPGELAESAVIQVTLLGEPGSIESVRATSGGGRLVLPEDPYEYTFSLEDLTDLLVLANIPSDGAANVSPETTIQVVFNEAIDLATLGADIDQEGSIAPSFFLNPGDGAVFEDAVAGTYSVNANGDKLTFAPDVPLEHESTYSYTVTRDLCVPREEESEGGCLVSSFSFAFGTAAAPNLRVLEAFPDDGAAGVSLTTEVRVTFNNPILESSLHGLEGPSVFLTEGRLTADRASAVALAADAGCGTSICLGNDNRTVSFRPAEPLEPLTPHTIVATRDLIDANGYSLEALFLQSFVSEGAGLLAGHSLPTIGVNDDIFVQFARDMNVDSINDRTFFVTFVDRFGQVVRVPGDISFEATPGVGDSDACSQEEGFIGCDRAVFSPSLHQSNCIGSDRPLLYDTDYTVHLSPIIEALDGERLGQNPGFQVKTTMPPALESIRSEGVLLQSTIDDRDPLDQATDVPVNSSIVITFSRDMMLGGEHGIDNAANYRLFSGEEEILGAGLETPNARTAIWLPPAENLPFDAKLRFVVKGRSPGSEREIQDAGEGPLDSDVEVVFRTSLPMTVSMTPPADGPTNVTATSVLVFSRALHLPSATDETVFATNETRGALLTAILATSVEDPRSVVLIPVPAYSSGSQVSIHATTGVLDEIGNPLPNHYSFFHTNVGGVPSTSARLPRSPRVLPEDDSIISGGPVFTIIADGQDADNRNRLLPRSFTGGTMALHRIDELGGPLEEIDIEHEFIPGALGVEDRVEVRPTPYLDAGERYRLVVRASRIANIYTVADTSLEDIAHVYQVEEEPPVVTSMEVQTSDGPVDILGGSVAGVPPMLGPTDVSSPYLKVVFSEPVRPGTVGPSTVQLVDSSGGQVEMCYEILGSEVLLTPANPASCDDFHPRRVPLRSADGPYVLSIVASGVEDLAGNPVEATFSGSFEIDDVPPTVVSMSPADGDAALDGIVEVTFDKMMDPSSVCDLGSEASGLQVSYDVPVPCEPSGRRLQAACCSLDAETLSVATLRPIIDIGQPEPVEGFVGSRQYVTLAPAELTDSAGNALGLDVEQAFSTREGAPVSLCAVPSDGSEGVLTQSSVEVYFSEPIIRLTFEESFSLYRISDGVDVSCDFSYFDGDSRAVCTPTAGLEPSTWYEYLVGHGIRGQMLGTPLLRGLTGSFETAP